MSSSTSSETKISGLQAFQDLGKANSKYIRLPEPTTRILGEYTIICQDACYKPHKDEEAMKFPKVWKLFPRARSLVQVFKNDKLIKEANLSGFLKFSYDTYPKHVPIGYKPIEMIYTMKENGEYMPIAAFSADGQGFWIIGSKNVRIVVRLGHELQDLELYLAEKDSIMPFDRFQFACDMASHLFKSITDLKPLFSYLDSTGYTLNCESCRLTSQHLKSYDKDTIYGFSLTSVLTDTTPGITAVLPQDSVKIIESLGISSVYCKAVSSSDHKALEAINDEIAKEKNSEGSVVYVVGQHSNGDKAVIWAYKHKAHEYVFWRAVREIMRETKEVPKTIESINKLVDRFGKGSQKLEVLDLGSLTASARAFHGYWRIQFNSDPSFFTLWPTHLETFNQLDKKTKDKLAIDVLKIKPIETNTTSFVVVLIAPPGSGKSTLGKQITKLIDAEYLDQDMLGGNPKAYAITIEKKLKANTLLVLGKSHHNVKTRNDLYKSFYPGLTRVFIEFFHPDGADAWQKLSLSRINARGKNHQSLLASTPGLPTIIDGFFKSRQSLTVDETKNAIVIPIDVTKSVVEWTGTVITAMNKHKLINKVFDSNIITDTYAQVLIDEKNINNLGKPETKDDKKSGETKEEKKKPVLYYAVSVDTKAITDSVLNSEEVKTALSTHTNLKLQNKFHVTLKFFGGKGLEKDEAPFALLVNKKIKLVCAGIVADAKGIALAVTLPSDIPCDNAQPHITLGNEPKTKPFYSNMLFKQSPLINFSTPLTFDGLVVAVC
jgi:energy-coupling factor transporter ATP-binding protein EcfA2